MSVSVIAGDIFKIKTEAIVNLVNCVGVADKGLNIYFKKNYPAMDNDYIKTCGSGDLSSGTIMFWSTNKTSPNIVIYFPVKKYWKEIENLSYIKNGLDTLSALSKNLNLESLAMPFIGDAFNPNSIKIYEMVENEFKDSRVEILMVIPDNTPEARRSEFTVVR